MPTSRGDPGAAAPHEWVSPAVQTGHACNGCVVRVHVDVSASLTLQVPSWKPANGTGFVSSSSTSQPRTSALPALCIQVEWDCFSTIKFTASSDVASGEVLTIELVII